ncbi:MAG: hypothetical protein HOF11_19610 [Rhodospirillaceae bacterium]|nr:hypothetical protein [Rhodospirillaceae bacterium]
MSRLESAIHRLQAQRACLNWAAAEIASRPGPVLEFGLGNGRTYDHLRNCLPGREIFVFERQIAKNPGCLPDSRHLLRGDIRETLSDAMIRIGAPAVLAHYDIGTGDKSDTAWLAAVVGPALAPLLAHGALVVSSQALVIPGCVELPLPNDVAANRYYTLALLYGLIRKPSARFRVRSHFYYGELHGELDMPDVQVEAEFKLEDFELASESHTAATIYAIAMEAEARGLPEQTIVALLNKAKSYTLGVADAEGIAPLNQAIDKSLVRLAGGGL